ncbi:unnamed protein product [Rhizophagus irregularis]|nr:unnamed protein product [Rhizophagus irregularis]
MLYSSGNKVIDDFIRYTQSNYAFMKYGKMEFIPYDQFINIEFIAEGGFSKIYKATWVDGPINNWDKIRNNHWNITRNNNYTVVLKKLNNSKNITPKELNELQIFYQIYSDKYISIGCIGKYFGITQDPITKDIIIIMPYYNSGDLGISKSATECTDNSNENYGIIPYMAPEIFQGQKYTEASDIYSFGMIMWEFMTGRRPFWDRNHDTELIIDIYDGLRPPIATNAPEEYIELMKECWHSDPNKRPTAENIRNIFNSMFSKEYYHGDQEVNLLIHFIIIRKIARHLLIKERSIKVRLKTVISTIKVLKGENYLRMKIMIILRKKSN